MKIAVVVGTRPELIKTWSVLKAMRNHADLQSLLIHTGQHYDYEMSKIFFEELSIQKPDYYLGVGSATPIQQTSAIMTGLEAVLRKEIPDILLVQGDTNTCGAAAIAALKAEIPVGHIEAGCRSFDRTMPEEINRVMIDAIATLLFAPSTTAYQNLMQEGSSPSRSFLVGNTGADSLKEGLRLIENKPSEFDGKYCVATIHRANNTEDRSRLREILQGMAALAIPTIFPVHPRTSKMIETFGLADTLENGMVRRVPPAGYLGFLKLMQNASLVITDSGGVQEEAAMLGKPTLTMRENTEWPETIWAGLNRLVRADATAIVSAATSALRRPPASVPDLYQDGAGERIVDRIIKCRDEGALKNSPFNMIELGYPTVGISSFSDDNALMPFDRNGNLTSKQEGKRFLTRRYRPLRP